jgi:hypothetical protein
MRRMYQSLSIRDTGTYQSWRISSHAVAGCAQVAAGLCAVLAHGANDNVAYTADRLTQADGVAKLSNTLSTHLRMSASHNLYAPMRVRVPEVSLPYQRSMQSWPAHCASSHDLVRPTRGSCFQWLGSRRSGGATRSPTRRAGFHLGFNGYARAAALGSCRFSA